jgi:hypothetical protein
VKTSEKIDLIADALSKAQAEMKGAMRDAANPFFGSKYADLQSVWDACREPLTKNGLSVVQFPKSKAYGQPEVYQWESKKGDVQYGVKVCFEVSVLTRLCHSSGQWMEDRISTLMPNGNAQSVGSAITYLRRYALQSVAGIAPEDDDGNDASGRNERQAPEPDKNLPHFDLRVAIKDAGQELEAKCGGIWHEHVRDASAFTPKPKDGKDQPEQKFGDPFNPKLGEKWLSLTLKRLNERLAEAAHTDKAAGEAAELFA